MLGEKLKKLKLQKKVMEVELQQLKMARLGGNDKNITMAIVVSWILLGIIVNILK